MTAKEITKNKEYILGIDDNNTITEDEINKIKPGGIINLTFDNCIKNLILLDKQIRKEQPRILLRIKAI